MTERLHRAVELYQRSAAELERAAAHARVAAELYGDQEVPRGAAHALAAEGHAAAAGEALEEAAKLHATASRLPGDEASR